MRTIIFSVFGILLAACGSRGEGLLITNVNVVDVVAGETRSDQEIWIVGTRIESIGPAGEIGDRAARVFDAEGAYALPGLYDAHVHVDTTARLALMLPEAQGLEITDENIADDLTAYTLYGVAKVIALEGEEDLLAARAAGGLTGALIPRLAVASSILDGPDAGNPTHKKIADPAAAEAAVEAAAAEGYDLIKAYGGLPEESYKAILAAAEERGLPVAAHLPLGLDLETAIDPRLDNVAHAEEVTRGWDGEDETYFERAADLLAERGVSLTPNLVAYREIIGQVDDIEAHLAERDMALAPPLARIYSTPPHNGYVADFGGPDIRERAIAYFRRTALKMDELTRLAQDRGVLILAGTDVGNPTMFSGESLYREIALLAQAGLRPYEALAAATINPARFLGEAGERGSLEAGKAADIVLFDVDPAANIDTLSRAHVFAVVRAGALLGRADLDTLAAQLSEAYDAREAAYRANIARPTSQTP